MKHFYDVEIPTKKEEKNSQIEISAENVEN